MDCNFPAKFSAGLTLDRLVTSTAYPAPEWALSVLLRGPSSIDLEATAEGEKHRFKATATQTAAWVPGVYAFALRATNTDGDVAELERGTFTVLPDINGIATGDDQRTQARRTLDAINAVIEKRASQDQQRYVINNRELWRTPIADLLALRDRFLAEVRREENAACGRSQWGPAVRVRF